MSTTTSTIPTPGSPMPINIVFDGPPSHESGRFIEVETDDGRGINVGEWIQRPDGLWSLRITALPTGPSPQPAAVFPCGPADGGAA